MMKRETAYYIRVACILVGVLLLTAANAKYSDTIDNLQEASAIQKTRLDNLRQENSDLRLRVRELEAVILDMQDELVSAYEQAGNPVQHAEWHELNVKATAYCNCSTCCGQWAGGPTATGVMPVQGRTIAVDPSVIPLGATIQIDGDPNLYRAEDTGRLIKGNRIDIFLSDHDAALEYGVKDVTVYWKE